MTEQIEKLDADMLANLIRAGIADAQVDIQDIRGDGECYALRVASRLFSGMNLLEQHRAVYHVIGHHWDDTLFGIQLTTSEH